MHALVTRPGQPGWVAALTPLSVDGMIVAASTTLLADSRSDRNGGMLPWALLVAGSIASLAANVAVAEPTLIGRVIAAWPSSALTASYELLTRQLRRRAGGKDAEDQRQREPQPARPAAAGRRSGPGLRLAVRQRTTVTGARVVSCNCRHGSGRWPIGARMEACPAAGLLRVLTVGRSGGVGSSRTLAWPVPSVARTYKLPRLTADEGRGR